ncbi:MAG: hypothetical protein AAFU79_14250 [Myxococcota bacterium]
MSLIARFGSWFGLLLVAACAASTPSAPPPLENDANPLDGSSDASSGSAGTAVGGPGIASGSRAQLVGAIAANSAPCRSCTVDLTGVVKGTFRGDIETCGDGGADLYYPLRNPVIQVVQGEQALMSFAVDVEGDITGDRSFAATLGQDAKPDGWELALLWITDASGRPCASLLEIVR